MIGGRGGRRWREASFAVLDFETTGLDLAQDHVLSYGVVPVDRGRIQLAGAVYRVVRPPIPVPAESIRVHGIRPVELETAPPLDAVVDELLRALAERTLVAYAAGIELGFLERLHRLYGGRRARRAIDVHGLARFLGRADGTAPETFMRLADLAAAHGVPPAPTHHAFGDALTTAQLFLVFATRMERIGSGRLRDLLRAGRPQIA